MLHEAEMDKEVEIFRRAEEKKEGEKCNVIVALVHLAYFSIGTPIRLPHSVQEPS